MVVKVYDTDASAIIDTGSPATVISRGLFDRMGDEYVDNQQKVKSNIKIRQLNFFLAMGLMKARFGSKEKNSRFEPYSNAARLNNICLPRI